MTDREQSTSIRAELDRALGDAPHLTRDIALIALARKYADLLDEAVDRLAEADEEDEAANFNRMTMTVYRLGERLERALDRMGMSPAARPAIRGGDPHGADDPARAALEALRAEAANPGAPSGIDYASIVDPAVTAADA